MSSPLAPTTSDPTTSDTFTSDTSTTEQPLAVLKAGYEALKQKQVAKISARRAKADKALASMDEVSAPAETAAPVAVAEVKETAPVAVAEVEETAPVAVAEVEVTVPELVSVVAELPAVVSSMDEDSIASFPVKNGKTNGSSAGVGFGKKAKSTAAK